MTGQNISPTSSAGDTAAPRRREAAGSGSRTPAAGQAPALGRVEEVLLLRRARLGDLPAQERLIEAHIRLVYRIARRYRCRSYSQDDLVQEGVVGLLLAIQRWDEARGCRLSTYAVHWIRQAVTRAVEQNDRLIHVPMQASVELRRLHRIREIQTGYLGRPPTEAELGRAAGVPEERVEQLLGTIEDAVSLEALVGPDDETSLLELVEDPTMPTPEQGAIQRLRRLHLQRLLASLQPRERWVVEERFGLDGGHPRTLDEISRLMRISRERVRQIEARAIQKLRGLLRDAHWD